MLDPGPITFRREHTRGIRAVRDAAEEVNTRVTLKRPIIRNAFLRGCHDLTGEGSIEHLIVGFGERHRSTTMVTSLYHCVGNTGSVSIPDDLSASMKAHTISHPDNELVVHHNHPRGFWNTWFYRGPVASVTDRETLWSQKLAPVQLVKSLLGRGDLLFFISENGRVRQFEAPAVLHGLAELERRFPPSVPLPGF